MRKLVFVMLVVVMLLTLTAAVPTPMETPATLQDPAVGMEKEVVDGKIAEKVIRNEDCEIFPIGTVGGPYDKTVVSGYYKVCVTSTGETITQAIP